MAKKKLSKSQKRKARMRESKKWLKQYNGHNYLSGYIKKINVNVSCAVAELEKLDIELTPKQIEGATQTAIQAAEKNRIKKARKKNRLKSQHEGRVQAIVYALEKNSISVDADRLRAPLANEGVSKKKREYLKKVKKWLLKYSGENLYDDYRKKYGRSPIDTFSDFNLLGLPFPEELKEEIIAKIEQRKIVKQENRLKRIEAKKLKKLLEPEFDEHEVYDEVYGYLKQSRISEKNKKRLRKFALSNIPKVAEYGQVVLEIAEIQEHKRRRRKLLARKHPHLLKFLNETGLIMAHGY